MKKILFIEGPIQTGKSTLIRELLGSHLSECGGFTSQRLIDAENNTRGFRIGPAATTPLTAPLGGLRPGPASVNPALETEPPNEGNTPTGDEPGSGNGSAFGTAPAFAAPDFAAPAFAAPAFAAPAFAAPDFLLTSPDGVVYPGVFKYFDQIGCVHKDQEVFDILGTLYLRPARNCPLMLLDEIGGSELLSDPFRYALEALLESDTPILGVIKQTNDAKRMQAQYGFDPATEPAGLAGAGLAGQAGAGLAGQAGAGLTGQAGAGLDRPGADSRISIEEYNLQLRRMITEDLGGEILCFERGTESEPEVRDRLTQFIDSIF